MLPRALTLERRDVLRTAPVVHGGLGVDQDAGQLVQPVGGGRVEAPQPALRLEARDARVLRSGAALLDVDEGGRPLTRPYVHAPTIEMKVERRVGMQAEARRRLAAGVGPVKAHDPVILVLHTDAAHELSRGVLVDRRDLEYQAAHIAQKFAAHVIEVVRAAIEIRCVEDGHLRESARKKGGRLVTAEPGALLVVAAIQERFVVHPVGKAHSTDKIVVANGRVALPRGGRLLNVGLDNRAMGPQVLEEFLLMLDNPVEQSVDSAPVLRLHGGEGRDQGEAEQATPETDHVGHNFVFTKQAEK